MKLLRILVLCLVLAGCGENDNPMAQKARDTRDTTTVGGSACKCPESTHTEQTHTGELK